MKSKIPDYQIHWALRIELWDRLKPIFKEYDRKIDNSDLDIETWLGCCLADTAQNILFVVFSRLRETDRKKWNEKKLTEFAACIMKDALEIDPVRQAVIRDQEKSLNWEIKKEETDQIKK